MASMLFVPLLAFSGDGAENNTVLKTQRPTQTQQVTSATTYDSFRIKDAKSGKISELSAREYICGVVAAEMPALYESEALKAQAVAAYTFACYKRETATDDFDLTTDFNTYQSYISPEDANIKWGEKAQEYTKRISDAVDAVFGQLLTYKGATALTVYHAISSGKTSSAKDVWGDEVPYLTEVDSSADNTASGYLTKVGFSADELSAAMSALAGTTENPAEWFGQPHKNSAGRVLGIPFCNKTLTGGEIATALGLRSAAFDVECSSDKFTFTVYGYGHGVGMSQNGANEMAKQGSSYKEILSHYYPNCTLKTKK